MSDITLCANKDCLEAQNCYRVSAKPDEHYQSYSDFKEICNESNDYEHQIKINEN